MSIIEDNGSSLPETEKPETHITLLKAEWERTQAIAKEASTDKVFYIRLTPEDIEKIQAGENIVSVIQDTFRNHVIVFADDTKPVPDNAYFNNLLDQYGKVITV